MQNGPCCPAVTQWKVVLSDGSVHYPKLPGSANVDKVAGDYAKEKGLTVKSIDRVL